MDDAVEGAVMSARHWPDTLAGIANMLRSDPGVLGKRDIETSCSKLGLNQNSEGRPGDDCAILTDQSGFLLFAMEGFINAFVEADPWFAGWCGVMVNMSDILAMGGRPVAVTDAVWAADPAKAELILDGMRAASDAYGIPIVGGHTNLRAGQSQLAVSIIGRAKNIITSFDARPGDVLIAAIDHRGEYRAPFNNWQAALSAPGDRLRRDMELLPSLSENGLCRAGKDISQGGVAGTATMLAECSGVAIDLDLEGLEAPDGVPLARWLVTFPSFGFLLSVSVDKAADVIAHFRDQDIWAGAIGNVAEGSTVSVSSSTGHEVLWDHARNPYLGLPKKEMSDA
ncbi:sll0787 family AIR synthase-like protein [Roseibium sp. HPY-6]|uniref:sll0787 family AIR synthase-like protein n=1 Tax=Roseibium sp. HPY-6 TaxID=3229852 RepID=UPI00338EAB06